MQPRRRGSFSTQHERRRGAKGGPPPSGDVDDPERRDYGPGYRNPEGPELPESEPDESESQAEKKAREGGPYESRLHRGGRDASVRRAVEAALWYDTWVDADRIRVEVNDGVVTLRGALIDRAEVRRAIADARSVPGTREVLSELRVESRRAADRLARS